MSTEMSEMVSEPDQAPSVEVEISVVVNQISRVPPQFRRRKSNHKYFDPAVVSLGPYHHGKPEYRHAEIFKRQCLEAFVAKSNGKDKSYFYEKVLRKIHLVRSCYEEVEYDDQYLAWMMLYDTCYLINHLHLMVEVNTQARASTDTHLDMLTAKEFTLHFGRGRYSIMYGDVCMLENQIPFWLIRSLFCLQSDEGESIWNKLLLQLMNIGGPCRTSLPWSSEPEPLHLVHALHYRNRAPVKVYPKPKNPYKYDRSYQFRSVTRLQAKGIRIRLGRTNEVSFTSHAFYGQLELPSINLSLTGSIILSNVIAFEMSTFVALTETPFCVFMKSLIESADDVKILREGRVMMHHMDNDDEVVYFFKNLDTFDLVNNSDYVELKNAIDKHCCSKAKTWMAELRHTYFESPWTFIALLAAFCFLSLTFLQTFFTIRPIN